MFYFTEIVSLHTKNIKCNYEVTCTHKYVIRNGHGIN